MVYKRVAAQMPVVATLWSYLRQSDRRDCQAESRFYGIIIRMYAEFGEPHHLAHFHAYYQDEVAVFRLSPVELLSGALPKRQLRLVEAWAELHEAELINDWERLHSGQRPVRRAV